MIPRFATWFHVGTNHWLYGETGFWPAFAQLPNEHEHRVGFGYLTPLLSLWGLILARRRPWALPLLGAALALVLLATWLTPTFTPWKGVFLVVPGANAVRAVARVGALLLVPAAVGFCALVEALLSARRFALLGLAGAACMLEQGVTQEGFDRVLRRAQVEAITKDLPEHCQSFFYSPVGGWQKPDFYQVDAMWASLERGLPTLNGYSGFSPHGWHLTRVPLWTQADRQQTEAALARWVAHSGVPPQSVCWVQREVDDKPRAEFLGLRAPEVLTPGERARVAVSYRNVGLTTWHARESVSLVARAVPPGAGWWGLARVELPRPVPPGHEVTFAFEIHAPGEPGRYPFQWEVLQEGLTYLGNPTPLRWIEVRP